MNNMFMNNRIVLILLTSRTIIITLGTIEIVCQAVLVKVTSSDDYIVIY